MHPAKIKLCALFLLAGALCCLGAEILGIIEGGNSTPAMFLTGMTFIGFGVGVWGIYAAQSDKMSLIGVASMSIASFIQVFGSFSALSSTVSYDSLAETNWFFVFFLLWIFGTPLMGLSIIRVGVFPTWTGVVFILAPLITTITVMAGLPSIILNISNIAHSICFILYARLLLGGKAESSA